MLVPVQSGGANPPFFFIHGVAGLMPLGGFLARSLGAEQPIYVIHANGIDGRGPKPDNVENMVRIYVEEIFQVQSSGRVVIGGMCEGTLTAIEVARELQARSFDVGPVILADPPAVPPG